MNALQEFSIPYQGLSRGHHYFEFDVQDAFFESFPNSPVSNGELNVFLHMDCRESLFELDIRIRGKVELSCDRCTTLLEQPLEKDQVLVVRLTDEETDFSDDILFLNRKEPDLNIGQVIYEIIVLALPMVPVCPDDEQGNPGCDQKTLEKIHAYRADSGPEELVSPWEELKKLKNKKD